MVEWPCGAQPPARYTPEGADGPRDGAGDRLAVPGGRGDPRLLFTSPCVRAVQTAEILAEAIRYEDAVIVAPQLAPGFDLDGHDAILSGCPGSGEVALVGHEPDLGRLLTLLLSLKSAYAMRKGAIAALDVPDSGNRLRGAFAWLLDGERQITEVSGLAG